MIKHVSMLQMRNRLSELRKSTRMRHSSQAKSSGKNWIGITTEFDCLRAVLIDFSGRSPILRQTFEEPYPADTSAQRNAMVRLSSHLVSDNLTPTDTTIVTLLPDNELLEENLPIPRGITPRALTNSLELHVKELSERLTTPLGMAYCPGLQKLTLDHAQSDVPAPCISDTSQVSDTSLVSDALKKRRTEDPMKASSGCLVPRVPCYLAMCRQDSLNERMVAFSRHGFNLGAVESTTVALARLASFLPATALVYRTTSALFLCVGHAPAGWGCSRVMLPSPRLTAKTTIKLKTKTVVNRWYERLSHAYHSVDQFPCIVAMPLVGARDTACSTPIGGSLDMRVDATWSRPSVTDSVISEQNARKAREWEITALRTLLGRLCLIQRDASFYAQPMRTQPIPAHQMNEPGTSLLSESAMREVSSNNAGIERLVLAGEPFVNSTATLSGIVGLSVEHFSSHMLFAHPGQILPSSEFFSADTFFLPLALAWRGAYQC